MSEHARANPVGRRGHVFAGVVIASILASPLPAAAGELGLPEEPVELAELPERPRPIVELGQAYLAPTRISKGWTLPTGAVWQPSLVVWGAMRSALQAQFSRRDDRAEWATQLDLFGELSFTPTERLVIGIETFDDNGTFSGYRFGVDDADAEFEGGLDSDLELLYFEGDLGEMLPELDAISPVPLDIGFMIGRVPVVFQDGFLIDDRMTAIGLARNSILARGTSNLRLSFLSAWDGVHWGGNNRNGDDTRLWGMFAELDREKTTWALDVVYTDGENDTDGVFGGLSAIRRIEDRWNLTLRALGSYATREERPEVGRGFLLVAGLSFAPRGTHDVAYLNLIGSGGRYTAAARGPDRGGPLGRVGILFEAPGLGSIDAPLSNEANRMVGGAIGYQRFFNRQRTQLVTELAARTRYDDSSSRSFGAGLRLQQALGRRYVLRFDLYGVDTRDSGSCGGFRSELVVKF